MSVNPVRKGGALNPTALSEKGGGLYSSQPPKGAGFSNGVNLGLKKRVKELFRKHGVCPSKKLGQNFLVDKVAIRKFLKAADLKRKDIVLEIGPGIGNLTQELARKVKNVVAVEKDPKMCEILKETIGNFENIKVVKGDILKFNFQLPSPARSGAKVEKKKSSSTSIFNFQSISNFQFSKRYKVVANLPFYLTAPVIRKFLEFAEVRPRQMILIVQKEVAQRICSRPPRMSFLAVSVQRYAKPEIIAYISKKSFWPKPKVDSAIIKITPKGFTELRPLSILQRSDPCQLFFRIVRAGFSQPRKQILNNLSKELKSDKEKIKSWLLKNNIQPAQRAETLSIADWIKLAKNFPFL